MTTGKTIALSRQTFVGEVISLLFNMLSRLVITFLPRSRCFLISWLQSLSAVILEPRKIKSVTVSAVFPSICHEVMGPDAMILVFWMLRLSIITLNVMGWMPQPKDKDWLNEYKNKTPTYVVYKWPTSKQGKHTNWNWRAVRSYFTQIEIKKKSRSNNTHIRYNGL